MLAIALDPVGLIWQLVLLIIGGVIGMVLLVLIAKPKVPGLVTWLVAGLRDAPVVLNSYMDGFAEYKIMKKEPGSMIFNPGTSDEFLDRTVVDKKPMSTLHGHRVMFRVTASALPNSPDELAEIQRVLDHMDENEHLYPRLRQLQEFEIFGALGHDPQTARELLAQSCQVETEYLDQNGKVVKRPDDEVAADVARRVDEIMAEVELLKRNIKFLPRRSVFVDLARCVDATQLRIASQILKRYRAEIEALYRAKYGGVENSLWKGLVIGGGIGLIAGAVGVKLLTG